MPEDATAHGVVLWKRDLADVEGPFDAIMLHHALEHVPSPDAVFVELSRLLVEGGVLIVRVPVVPNAIYDEFGIDWPQLDAPRHTHTFTVKALGLLAAKHGFSVVNLAYDSEPWSLVVARSYALGVAMVDIPDTEKRGTPQDRAQVTCWNDEGRGDQVRLVLTRRATVATASAPQDETQQDSRTD
jgi:SAM-dependent methyltransferase